MNRRRFLGSLGAVGLATHIPFGGGWVHAAERKPKHGERVDLDFRHPVYPSGHNDVVTCHLRTKYYNWRLSDEEMLAMTKAPRPHLEVFGWHSPQGLIVLEDQYLYWRPAR